MSITVSLVEYIINLIATLGLVGVLALTALEILLAPIPGEVVMTFAGFLINTGKFGFTEVILVSITANLIGSLISYWIGLKLGRPALLKIGRYLRFSERDLEAAENFSKEKDL
ncbi:MAG: VTT domain-containing protein [Thermofilaceae archaeon]